MAATTQLMCTTGDDGRATFDPVTVGIGFVATEPDERSREILISRRDKSVRLEVEAGKIVFPAHQLPTKSEDPRCAPEIKQISQQSNRLCKYLKVSDTFACSSAEVLKALRDDGIEPDTELLRLVGEVGEHFENYESERALGIATTGGGPDTKKRKRDVARPPNRFTNHRRLFQSKIPMRLLLAIRAEKERATTQWTKICLLLHFALTCLHWMEVCNR